MDELYNPKREIGSVYLANLLLVSEIKFSTHFCCLMGWDEIVVACDSQLSTRFLATFTNGSPGSHCGSLVA
jgi:hypothetical protein